MSQDGIFWCGMAVIELIGCQVAVGRIARLEQENSALKAQVDNLQRPFSEQEAKEQGPNASMAEAGLANAMLLKRIGWHKWTKESIKLSVKTDAARLAEKGEEHQ